MNLFRVVSRDKARNGLLKGVMVVLFVPTNVSSDSYCWEFDFITCLYFHQYEQDIYYSVLTGCGAVVVKMVSNINFSHKITRIAYVIVSCSTALTLWVLVPAVPSLKPLAVMQRHRSVR